MSCSGPCLEHCYKPNMFIYGILVGVLLFYMYQQYDTKNV